MPQTRGGEGTRPCRSMSSSIFRKSGDLFCESVVTDATIGFRDAAHRTALSGPQASRQPVRSTPLHLPAARQAGAQGLHARDDCPGRGQSSVLTPPQRSVHCVGEVSDLGLVPRQEQ